MGLQASPVWTQSGAAKVSVWADDDATPQELPAILARAAGAFRAAGVPGVCRAVRMPEGDWEITAAAPGVKAGEAEDTAMHFNTWLRNLGFSPADLNDTQARQLRAKFDGERASGRQSVAAAAPSPESPAEPTVWERLAASLPDETRRALTAELQEGIRTIRRKALESRRGRRSATTPGEVALFEIGRQMAQTEDEDDEHGTSEGR